MSKTHLLEPSADKIADRDRAWGLRLSKNDLYDWAVCGMPIPVQRITDDRAKVTCKNCLRVTAERERNSNGQ